MPEIGAHQAAGHTVLQDEQRQRAPAAAGAAFAPQRLHDDKPETGRGSRKAAHAGFIPLTAAPRTRAAVRRTRVRPHALASARRRAAAR
ncbi:hypothetical protein ACE1SV_46300 [Streptomyces sennicomposti]